MIRHVLPYPLLSLVLLVLWLLLNQSLSPAHFLLGACLAIGGGLVLTALEPSQPRLRRPMTAVILGWLVLLDIVRSNIAVAQIILGGRLPSITSGFVEVPLQLRAPHGLAALATIITATPGTIWANYDPPTGVLTIHVLDLVDQSTWLRTIKGRYERRLMEIFE
jgi:multicomponent K+:H+ antiporter subunit E